MLKQIRTRGVGHAHHRRIHIQRSLRIYYGNSRQGFTVEAFRPSVVSARGFDSCGGNADRQEGARFPSYGIRWQRYPGVLPSIQDSGTTRAGGGLGGFGRILAAVVDRAAVGGGAPCGREAALGQNVTPERSAPCGFLPLRGRAGAAGWRILKNAWRDDGGRSDPSAGCANSESWRGRYGRVVS